MPITRRDAIAQSLVAAGVAASGNAQDAVAQAEPGEGEQFFLRLLRANDESVRQLVQQKPVVRGPSARLGRGGNVAALLAAFCSPQSSFHESAALLPLMEGAAQAFADALNPEGLLDAGNLSSPPDTGFVVEAMAAALGVARRMRNPQLSTLEDTVGRFLQRVGNALVTGGIHTPNHRWVVCSALARIHSLFPEERYVHRIDEWLGEGIYQDADGLFPERSPIYGRVEVNAFLAMARLLNRPDLLEPVRRHLTANLYLMQPDGEIEIVNSRRQDQTRPVHVANYYVEYRYMAIHDKNPAYAAVARLIAERPGEGLVEGANPIIYFLEDPVLRSSLPAGGEIPSNYTRKFVGSHMVRARRGDLAASIYGGSDWPLGIASGLAHNPTFFNFRKGKAILDSVRMGGRFFSLGVFRAEGIQVNGNEVVLQQRLEAPYYQPLPKEHRNPQGDYLLSPVKDERFWSKLDFPNRQMSNVQVLDQKVTITEIEGGFELQFEIAGHHGVPYAIELAFRPGGEFGGALQEAGQVGRTVAGEGSVLFQKEGMATYRVGGDAIEFGPGQADHEIIHLSGHSYQAHGATLRAAGNRVYITGYTPLRKVVTIRGVSL
ncbi:MAG: hypothetical protein KIT83_16135 [Bryobacterales bacterium]|nr:hypothetical protein [Bryobacterales bacterium]